jgi:membrane protease YdiL (CAAX protease family)
MTEAIDNPVAAPVAPGRLKRFWRHPITQLLARLVFFIVAAGAIGYLLSLVIHLPRSDGPGSMAATLTETGATPWLRQLRNLLPPILAYYLMVRLFERRRLYEFAPRKAALHSVAGWLVGTGILVAAALVLAIPGYYSVQGVDPHAPLLAPLLVLGIGAGVVEEIMFRGVLFRLVEESFGSWAAVVVSAIFFGLVHIANPNATWWSSLAIAVEAGLLLGMAFAWTRSLWFVIALHAAWNFTQGPLLGIAVSGIAVHGLLRSTLDGPAMLSGGEFGAEGSILTVLLCLGLAIYFTRKAIASGRIVAPFWRRRQPDRSFALPRFEAGAPGLRKP